MGTGTPALLGGRYELAEILGSGGTGAVLRARDTVLGREVAVKRMRPGQDPVLRDRLRAEARLAGSLHHPGIAQVYDFGEEPADDPDQEPAPYLVMQYVEGTSLATMLREERTLPPGQVMGIVAQVAAALQVAHDRGIVHRDLKPGNVIITPAGRAVLVDFGIARTLEAEPLTVTGTIVGTVDYISPEQGRGQGATPRSDLYSLGLVAYEALTGHKPFRRDSQLATALAHLNDEAPELDDEVPAGVRELVAEMTRKDPDARPQTAAVVAARATELSAELPRTTALPAAPGARAESGDHARSRGPRVRARRGRGSRRRDPDHSPLALIPSWLHSAQTLAVVAVALLLVVGVSVWAASSRSSEVVVPDVKGMTVAEAAAELLRADLDSDQRRVDHPHARRGTVLGQDPAAGASAEEDATVRLRVASGQARLRPDDVLGRRYRRAARVLAGMGLVPDRDEVVREGADGRVVDVGPVGRLPLGSTVTLVVAVPPPSPVAPDGTFGTDGAGAGAGAGTTGGATEPDVTGGIAGTGGTDGSGGSGGGDGGGGPGNGNAPDHAGGGRPDHAGGPGGRG